MIARLEFKLPDEQTEHRNAVESGRAFSLLTDILERIRGHFKYGECKEDPDRVLEDIRKEIYEAFPDIHER